MRNVHGVRLTQTAWCILIACVLGLAAGPAMAWFADSGEQNPGHNMLSGTSCGKTFFYQWDHFESCTARNFNATWNHGFVWSGRGWYHEDFWRPGYYSGSASYALIRAINQGGGDNGNNWRDRSNCDTGCDWITLYDQAVDNVGNYNGVRVDCNESQNGVCKPCGSSVTMVGQVRGYGERYSYLNRWTVIGPWSSTTITNTNGLDEANLYLYPYVRTDYGNTICNELWGGKTPFAYAPGDMNNAQSINFGAIWNQNPNQAAYALAWIYSPSGAGPKFNIGSDDGERCWVNGTMITDTGDASRGLTRDQDVTGGISMPAGWTRVLLKVQQGSAGGGWQGTVSLRNGGDNRQNEPSVSYQSDRYGGYSVNVEQDSWYPAIDVASFYGASNPQPNSNHYGNNTTVAASGTATANFIPLFREMHYQWGYGISGNTNFTDVTSSGTNWSNTTTGVTGHRRFHFFAVSKSGRTSFQSGAGTGGSAGASTFNWADGGPANYMDVYVDNVAPVNPTFASVTVAGQGQINLEWTLPLDQGVGIAAGAAEAADETSNSSSNHYRRGDVGAQVYRNGSTIVSAWSSSNLTVQDASLTPNTPYTYTLEARDNNSLSRGAWNNTTGQKASTTRYTWAATPSVGDNVVCDKTVSTDYFLGTTFTFSNPAGFGDGTHGGNAHRVAYFAYAFETSATYTFTGAEETWNTGDLLITPAATGTYYLHLKSVNGDGIGTAVTLAFGPFQVVPDCTGPDIDVQPQGQTICVHDDPVTLSVTASGDPAPTYQWKRDNVVIDGATASSYQTDVAGTYVCVVTSTCGQVDSDPAVITVTPDTDNDGVCDDVDGCPNDANKLEPGVCGCGVADVDSDSDGTLDCNDGCPNDPDKVAAGQCGCGVADTDTDSDGTADCNDDCPNDINKTTPGQCGCGNADTDSDSDGTADCNDGCPNDADKVAPGICGCGVADTDTDTDGTADCNDGCPNDANKVEPGLCGCGVADTDSDSDGTPDCNDGCPNDANKVEPGVCGCGLADTDSDNDGTPNCNDGCPDDPDKIAAGVCGCGVADTDTDNDGIPDCNDLCPEDPDKSVPGQCGCGVADTDTDTDGTADCNDGCPNDANKIAPGICGCGESDADSDNDGTVNCQDGCPADPDKIAEGQCGCGVADTDTDEDGTADCNDNCPNDANKVAPGQCGCGNADTDSDSDGTADCNDGCPNDPAKTAPGICGCGVADTDTDTDGTPDCNDGCPLDADKIAPGVCGCGIADVDSDNDGTLDCNDGCPADPDKTAAGLCGCGVADTDTDTDGTPDCNDLCADDPNKVEPGQCGCNNLETDTDSDGTADCVDGCVDDPTKVEPGQCGCGIADTDTDSDGTADCNDGCPSDADKIAPGVCGCGVADVDSDSDGTLDCNDGCPADPDKTAPGVCGCGVADVDGDNDGTLDCNDGCPSDPDKVAPGQCGCGIADTDSDTDGTADCNDLCPADPTKVEPGVCGCGVADTDTDIDGTPDCNDGCPSDPEKLVPGICGCGVADVDGDNDGTPDCNDLCPTDPEKVAPGQCGCGVADTDTDGDAIADCLDNCPAVSNVEQVDTDSNGQGDACELPVVVSAVSRKTHGVAGSFDIEVAPTHGNETRAGGPTLVVVTFNELVEGVGGLDNADVSVSSGSVISVSVAANVLQIGLSGVANAQNLTISLPGISDMTGNVVGGTICFSVLAGDTSADKTVNVFDLVTVRNVLNQSASAANFRSDTDASGAINVFDLVTIRNNLNSKITVSCP